MRDITTITNMLPDLATSLALFYSKLVGESCHTFHVDKHRYYEADAYYNAIVRELNCSPDIEKLNFYLNELQSILHNYPRPVLTNTDSLVLQCDNNRMRVTFWVSNTTQCEQVAFNIYATITSFTVPDLVTGYTSGALEVTLKAEVGGAKQFIQVQKSFADLNPLSVVLYYNDSIAAYMPTNKVADWASSVVNKSGVDYIQYTYTGPNRGSAKTKFIF